MKKNIGTIDAISRITCGLTGLAWSTARIVRHPYRSLPIVVAALSAMKVAEGVTRYCPMLDLFGKNTLDKSKKEASSHHEHDENKGFHDEVYHEATRE